MTRTSAQLKFPLYAPLVGGLETVIAEFAAVCLAIAAYVLRTSN